MAETGFIIDPTTGAAATIASEPLDAEDAKILRQYRKFLEKRGLKEALYCDRCWEHNLSHGCEAHITPNRILIRCRCRLQFFDGPTF